jgi:hypothetical protein
VVPPVLFLVLLAAVRYQFAGTAPHGRSRGTQVTPILRHRSGKLRKHGGRWKCFTDSVQRPDFEISEILEIASDGRSPETR